MQKNFLVDINPDIELPEYDLVLCKLNGEPLQELHNIENFEIKAYFANIDEISFDVPLYRTSNDGENIRNEIYDLVDGSMLVLVNSSKYFILTKPEIKTNEETGEIYKNILGFSREYELAQKRLVGYEGVSRLLYDYTNSVDENGLEIGFLNYIEKNTSWRVGYINADLLTKYRYLSFSKSTYLQAFNEVQKTFGCLFKFNTIDKTIDVYEAIQLGKDQGLYISDKNFINSLNQSINHDEIKTRLYLYGQNNISVQSINITGQPYIDSFDFFKNTKYMSQDLIDALNVYEDYIVTKEGLFNGYLAELNILNDNLNTKKIELATLITELKVIESNLDIAISSNQPTSDLKSQQTTKINEINNKQLEIDNLMTQINTIHTNIDNLSIDISLNNHLTEEQARELDPFIREDEYSDSNYTEDNLQELLDEGKKILAKVSYPALQFDVDVYDFLSLIEAQHIWDKLILGDYVTLEHEELDFSYKVRLVGYTHSPDNNELNLIFSNRNSVDDANIYLKDLLESVTTTASTVDYNRFKWDKGEEAEFIINQYVNENLNLAKQQIMKADGQQPMIDERGIWLIKENSDGTVDNAQLRLVNNAIVMTNDNWNTPEWALTADKGINAKLINGKLGQFAQVYANQIIVGEDGETIPDEALGGSLVKQNTFYNGVMINTNEGLVVTRSDNKVRTALNATDGIKIQNKTGTSWVDNFYVDTNGTIQAKNIVIDEGRIIIDKDKIRVSHAGGQYSQMNYNGFVRKWPYGEGYYLNDIHVVTELASGSWGSDWGYSYISLPERFRGRQVEAFLVPRNWDTSALTFANEQFERLKLVTEVNYKYMNQSIPEIRAKAYLEVSHLKNGVVTPRYFKVSYDLIVIGY